MAIIHIKRKRTPLLQPNSISQLLKAVRKGHLTLREADRLAATRHRRGSRGHERRESAE